MTGFFSPLSLSYVPSNFLLPYFLGRLYVFWETFWIVCVSELLVGDEKEGFSSGRKKHTVNMLKHLICPKEPGASRDALSPHRLANAAVTPDLLAEKGPPLVFDVLL